MRMASLRWSLSKGYAGCRLAATVIAAVALMVSVAEAGDEVYLRVGLDLDRPADTWFTDRDCASTVPAALYGCGMGPDGAPHRSVGDFGTVPTVEVGIGYAATAALRLEAMLEYRPRFDFAGQTNFLEPGLQQSAAADVSSLAGLVATYLDLPGLGLSSVGPFDPFIGAGVGAVRNRIGETHMTFPRTTTIVPGASHVDVVWMVTAGVATSLGEHVTLDVAWRYTDAGTVRTGRGEGQVVWRDGSRAPLMLNLAPTEAALTSHGLRLSLRYAFLTSGPATPIVKLAPPPCRDARGQDRAPDRTGLGSTSSGNTL